MIVDKNVKKKYDFKSNEESEESSNYLDIWRVNPSYKDINEKRFKAKIAFLCVILVAFVAITYLLTLNFFIALGIALFTLIFFIVAFSDDFFSFQKNFSLMFRKCISVNPFENFAFWRLDQDPKTILILNKNDAMTSALRMFKVKTLPENVYPTINHFLKATFNAELQFSYQVVQKPRIKLSELLYQDDPQTFRKKHLKLNTTDSLKTSIYFSVYTDVKGVLNKYRLVDLLDKVQEFSNKLDSHISSNFPHTKIEALSGKKLINALRTFFSQQSVDTYQDEESLTQFKKNLHRTILKASFILFITVYTSIILSSLEFYILVIVFADLAILFSVVFLWWRKLISNFSDSRLRSVEGAISFDPFNNVEFYKLKHLKDTLFMHIDGQLLIALKMLNLRNAIQPTTARPDKVFREINKHKIAFVYSLFASPAKEDQFVNEWKDELNEKTKKELAGIIFHPQILDSNSDYHEYDYYKYDYPKYDYPEAEFEQWMLKRSGMWKTTLNLSVYSQKFSRALDDDDFFDLEREVLTNVKTLRAAFEDNFLIYKLVPLKSQLLISGIQSDAMKNTLVRLNGTHLNYLYFQGKTVIELAKVVSEFKKGVETRIAAEFNTPFHLKNFVTIGHTINTEFLENEVPAGFLFEQLKGLLITNGTITERRHLKMRIVAELVKADISSVIFDYSGDWSKLIRYFKDSRYNDRFLYFKFGQSFHVNLIRSGIKYDQHNHEYLNYFYDVFALAFKAQRMTIELLKNTVVDNEKLDFSTLALQLMVSPEWEKNIYSESLISLLKDFCDMGVFYSDKAFEYDNDVKPLDFIKTDKTVIIDLSPVLDFEQQVFATFVILSKFIHYINHSNEYQKKIVFVPYIDLFFERYYIDNNSNTVNSGKISKFLEPLVQHGFGLIFSANQIGYLHPTVFNYLKNIVSFRATDSRDIAILKNNMNLQELRGTGYYSPKRNNTYQIEYLMNMTKNEIIVKRTDSNQPFPVEINSKQFYETLPLSDERIFEYMETQGYNLKDSEQKLLAKLKKTLFEKDFGIYAKFIKDVKKFLHHISTVDEIGNLSKAALKKQLLNYIYPTASKRTSKERKIKAIRNDIFEILVDQDYLVESHPPMAGGGEAMRTSYAVGTQYQRALDDESEDEGNIPTNADVEIIEKESEIDSSKVEAFNEPISQEDFNEIDFRRALEDQTIQLFSDLFKMYKLNNRMEFETSLEFGINLISKFFTELHTSYLKKNPEHESKFNKLKAFVEYLIKNKKIPFTKTDLQRYIKKINQYLSDSSDCEEIALKIYDLVSTFRAELGRKINQN